MPSVPLPRPFIPPPRLTSIGGTRRCWVKSWPHANTVPRRGGNASKTAVARSAISARRRRGLPFRGCGAVRLSARLSPTRMAMSGFCGRLHVGCALARHGGLTVFAMHHVVPHTTNGRRHADSGLRRNGARRRDARQQIRVRRRNNCWRRGRRSTNRTRICFVSVR